MGIDAEIVPGILPVSNVAQTRKFAASCGAAIPRWMDELFEGLDNLPAARQLVAATVAAELCGQLYAGGVRHFHFYTLNRAELAYAISHLLGLRPRSTMKRSRPHERPRKTARGREDAHPHDRRRLRDRDPEPQARRGRLSRFARSRPRPEGQ
jgi:hypothetical protein